MDDLFPKLPTVPRWRFWLARIFGKTESVLDKEEGFFIRYSTWRGSMYVHEYRQIPTNNHR